MDHNNFSSTSTHEPFAAAAAVSFDFDDEMLDQWLSNLPPITPHQPDDTSLGDESVTNNELAVDHTQYSQTGNVTARNKSFVAGSSSSKAERKMKAVDVERKRRKEMSTLFHSLRSILPVEYIRGKRSTADHLQEAVKYIKDMQDNVEKLNKKRDSLLKGTSSSSSTSTCNSSNQSVTVKQCREGFFEIVVKTNNADNDYELNQQRVPLSKAVRLLSRERLSIINSITSKIGNNLIHTIHAQVDEDGRAVDRCLLQQQIIDCYR